VLNALCTPVTQAKGVTDREEQEVVAAGRAAQYRRFGFTAMALSLLPVSRRRITGRQEHRMVMLRMLAGRWLLRVKASADSGYSKAAPSPRCQNDALSRFFYEDAIWALTRRQQDKTQHPTAA
jgi:hypothetical protein